MRILQTIQETRQACTEMRSVAAGIPRILGLVPTMGALHDGHLSLIRAARKHCGIVVASIFVNPLQFGPNEDLALYPRTFDDDCAKLEEEGVDLLFAPAPGEMYPDGSAGSVVEVLGIGDRLDGRSRPGHFIGVATIVAKLFNIVSPEFAYFGQKDAAQVAVLRAMVRDLNFSVELVVMPTVRDGDGLALSSRNRYLSAEERGQALMLSRALGQTRELASQGVNEAERLRLFLLEKLQASPALRIDYVEIVDPETLEAVSDASEGALVAVAAWIGKTRLIDNILLSANVKPTGSGRSDN